jgi:hypothetical protein
MKTMKVNFWLLLIALLLPMICFGADGDGVTNEKQRVTIDMEDLGYVVGVILLVGTFLKNGVKWFPNDWIPAVTWIGGALLYMGLSKGWGDLRQWLAALMAVASATGLHSATTSTFDAAKNLKNGAVVVLLFGALSLGLMPVAMIGCSSAPVQVKAVADPIVVNAEWISENGANSLDQFLAFERNNEAVLKAKDPSIHEFANLIRDDVTEIAPGKFVPKKVLTLRRLTMDYQRDKTAANGDALQAATKALLNLVNETRAYIDLPPLVFPAAKPSVIDLMKNAPTNAPNL